MTADGCPAGRAPADARREALMTEYGEVVSNFRLLTDIRFKLLALLPIAAAAATALLSAGQGRSADAEVRALALSLFGALVTVALATYNDRNDQLYDRLVGRAASIEWQLGLPDGAFANRPAAWFTVVLPGAALRHKKGAPRWPVNHRNPVAWIYCASTALWLFSAGAALVQLAWGTDPAAWWALALALVPAGLVPWRALSRIRAQRESRAEEMRLDAAEATRIAAKSPLGDLAGNDEFLAHCQRLGVSESRATTRAAFYGSIPDDEARQFLPKEPARLIAAHFVALVTDLPAEWIDDCERERRVKLPPREGATVDATPKG